MNGRIHFPSHRHAQEAANHFYNRMAVRERDSIMTDSRTGRKRLAQYTLIQLNKLYAMS